MKATEQQIKQDLKAIGRASLYPDMVEHGFFQGWNNPLTRVQAVRDERISVALNHYERNQIDNEMAKLRKQDPSIRLADMIRSKILELPDIAHWATCVEGIIDELTEIEAEQPELRRRVGVVHRALEAGADSHERDRLQHELHQLETRLSKVVRQNANRRKILSGRIPANEYSLVSFRAYQLQLPISEYVRRLLFDYLPGSPVDNHMSVQHKKQFYLAIELLHAKGWADPPTETGETWVCAQCGYHNGLPAK